MRKCESIITRLPLHNIKILIIFVKATTGALTFNEIVISERSTKSHRKCVFLKNSAFVSAIVQLCVQLLSTIVPITVLFSPRAAVPSPDAFTYSSERGAEGKRKGREGR